jgi:aspartate aminotransferase
MVHEYQARRDAIVAGLNAIPGITCQRPQGAFYVFPNIKSIGLPSNQLAGILLEKAGVAVLPGSDFGQHGEGYLRLTYANSLDNIRQALDRIGKLVAHLYRNLN